MLNIINRFSGSKLLVAGLLVGGSLGTFGYAAATSTPSTTVFYACLNVKAGTMNSINTTAAPKCARGNVNISWNATGPKGDTGTPGTNGPKGDTGAPATSLSGIQFVKGYVIQESAYLRSANLNNANLPSAILNNANLSSAILDYANLTSANLSGADLHGASLLSANLTGANLHGANLNPGAFLYGANLTNANLTNANLYGGDLRYADLSHANLTGATCPNGIVHDQSGANC